MTAISVAGSDILADRRGCWRHGLRLAVCSVERAGIYALIKSAFSGARTRLLTWWVSAKRGRTPKSYGGYSSEGFNRPSSPSLIIRENMEQLSGHGARVDTDVLVLQCLYLAE